MGTAFSFPCSDNNHSVSIVVGTHLENDFIDKINSKKHPHLTLSYSKKTLIFLNLSNLMKRLNKKIDLIVVVAVISKGIEWASIELSKFKKNSAYLITYQRFIYE